MDVQKLIEEVKAMSVVELNDLVKALEEEFGCERCGSRCSCRRSCSRSCSRRGREDRVQHRPQGHRPPTRSASSRSSASSRASALQKPRRQSKRSACSRKQFPRQTQRQLLPSSRKQALPQSFSNQLKRKTSPSRRRFFVLIMRERANKCSSPCPPCVREGAEQSEAGGL